MKVKDEIKRRIDSAKRALFENIGKATKKNSRDYSKPVLEVSLSDLAKINKSTNQEQGENSFLNRSVASMNEESKKRSDTQDPTRFQGKPMQQQMP